jgi:hypothetical protein
MGLGTPVDHSEPAKEPGPPEPCVILRYKPRHRIAQCEGCGSHFRQTTPAQLFCAPCSDWRQAGKFIIAAARLLDTTGNRS